MSLIAQYTFKDNCNDETGNGYNGTASNVTYQNKPAGCAFPGKLAVFNGTNSFADFGNHFDINVNQISFEFWGIYNSGNGMFFCKGGNAAVNGGYYFHNNGSVIEMSLNANSHQIASFPRPTAGTLNHYAVVKDGNQLVLYLNGVQTTSLTITLSLIANTYSFLLGKYYNNGLLLNGSIGDFKIYDHALTQEEVHNNYRSGLAPIARYLFNDNANDEMGNHNGTPSNITYSDKPKGYYFPGKLANFNGINSRILLQNNFTEMSGASKRTVAFWGLSNKQNAWQSFTHQGYTTGGEGYVELATRINGSNIKTVGNGEYPDDFGAFNYNVLERHVIVYNGGVIGPSNPDSIIWYVNGVASPRTTTHPNNVPLNTRATNNALGAFLYQNGTSTYWLSGQMGDLQFWNEEWTAERVLKDYKDGTTSPNKGNAASLMWLLP